MTSEPSEAGQPPREEPPEPARRRRLPALSLGARILVFVVGWTLLLIGVVGLALPGIQGILTILIGAAVLSLASETIYRLMRRMFERWPWLWDRLDGFRHKAHKKLSGGEKK